MINCPQCHVSLDVNSNNFYSSSARKSGFQRICKKCTIYNAKWRYHNSTLVKVETKQNALNARQKLQTIVNNIKREHGCYFCHETEPCCLQFHHTNPGDKNIDISQLCSNKSKLKLFNEIKKCIVLCANCHFKLHFGLIATPLNVQTCTVELKDYFDIRGKKIYFKSGSGEI